MARRAPLKSVLLACALAYLASIPPINRCQEQTVEAASITTGQPAHSDPSTTANPDSPDDPIVAWEGLPVRHIAFEGVSADRLAPLSGHLAQGTGAPLTEENVKKSLRQLYATGLFETVEVAGSLLDGGVDLVFRGKPSTFIGIVSVVGATGATMNTQLQRASQLDAGTRLTQAKLIRAVAQMRSTLEENGYHESAIAQNITPRPGQQLADIAFHVVSGPRARVGKITVSGDSGMSLEDFRLHSHLWKVAHVDHDTVNRALDGVLKEYQKQERLEAEVKLESASYDQTSKTMNYHFSANRGPLVNVEVEGASIDAER